MVSKLTAEEARELSDPDLARFPDSKRIFQRDGQLYKEGEIFRQPELARTLQRIAANPDSFYHGKMAHELVSDLKKGGALITLEDLAAYTVVERAPSSAAFTTTPSSAPRRHLQAESYSSAHSISSRATIWPNSATVALHQCT